MQHLIVLKDGNLQEIFLTVNITYFLIAVIPLARLDVGIWQQKQTREKHSKIDFLKSVEQESDIRHMMQSFRITLPPLTCSRLELSITINVWSQSCRGLTPQTEVRD